MATNYIENGSSGNQYYFDAINNSTSQAQKPTQDRSYASPIPITTSVGPSEFTAYPAGVSGVRSPNQQIRSDQSTYNQNDSYQLPQQHQSVAGFNKTVSQQQYQSSPSSAPQVRATVRSVSSQEQQQQQQQQQYTPSVQHQQQQQPQQRQQQAHINYQQQGSPQPSQISPQQNQYQYDSRQQTGQPTGVSGYYQTPGPAQYPPHELDQRTENPSRSREQHAQVFVHVFFHTTLSCNSKCIYA
jgi:mediator of RNA polymerase II transcription subunit 25